MKIFDSPLRPIYPLALSYTYYSIVHIYAIDLA